MNIGKKLKEARTAAGVAQKELAERLGVYQKDISRWENGERTPSLEVFARICKILNVSADELLEINSFIKEKEIKTMTKEREIEILMMDGCTKVEAEKLLKNGSTVIADFEEQFNNYMQEWEINEEEIPAYKRMIEEKIPVSDWGIVEEDSKTYYIMYVL